MFVRRNTHCVILCAENCVNKIQNKKKTNLMEIDQNKNGKNQFERHFAIKELTSLDMLRFLSRVLDQLYWNYHSYLSMCFFFHHLLAKCVCFFCMLVFLVVCVHNQCPYLVCVCVFCFSVVVDVVFSVGPLPLLYLNRINVIKLTNQLRWWWLLMLKSTVNELKKKLNSFPFDVFLNIFSIMMKHHLPI